MSDETLNAAAEAFEEATGREPNDYELATMKAAIAEESDEEDGE